MSPFKGQGANQSLADASLLARYLAPALTAMASGVGGMSSQRDRTSRLASELANFEREMSDRAQPKVEASREAAVGYHSATALFFLSTPTLIFLYHTFPPWVQRWLCSFGLSASRRQYGHHDPLRTLSSRWLPT